MSEIQEAMLMRIEKNNIIVVTKKNDAAIIMKGTCTRTCT
jgi:hypothetical protein